MKGHGRRNTSGRDIQMDEGEANAYIGGRPIGVRPMHVSLRREAEPGNRYGALRFLDNSRRSVFLVNIAANDLAASLITSWKEKFSWRPAIARCRFLHMNRRTHGRRRLL